uniref:Synaptophysin like 1 n=1 Tax=Malurus cyaneus samueli TaxID=2593467 RepID=A0A8C5TY71_9PASS
MPVCEIVLLTCGGTWNDAHLVGNFSSSAQLFVALAALVFLYCIAALTVSIVFLHFFNLLMGISLVTFVWAKALADIKVSTGARIIPGIESCKAPGTTCYFLSVTSMGILNVSVVCMPPTTWAQ